MKQAHIAVCSEGSRNQYRFGWENRENQNKNKADDSPREKLDFNTPTVCFFRNIS